MDKPWKNEPFGAYNGVTIRCKKKGKLVMVSASDILKATGDKSKYRFDKWRKDNQNILEALAKKKKLKPLRNKEGLIIELPNLFENIKGDRYYQGNFISQEIVELYVKWINKNCYQWFKNMFAEEKSVEAAFSSMDCD